MKNNEWMCFVLTMNESRRAIFGWRFSISYLSLANNTRHNHNNNKIERKRRKRKKRSEFDFELWFVNFNRSGSIENGHFRFDSLSMYEWCNSRPAKEHNINQYVFFSCSAKWRCVQIATRASQKKRRKKTRSAAWKYTGPFQKAITSKITWKHSIHLLSRSRSRSMRRVRVRMCVCVCDEITSFCWSYVEQAKHPLVVSCFVFRFNVMSK